MIVWLASYPRSGNTLLRTILKRCLDLDSYTDEVIHVESPIRSDASLIGHRELPASWDEFYRAATQSAQTFLVKTHLPPRDAQPCIYVVRDGRSAVRSYKKYYEQFFPEHKPSLYQVIAGDDAYGDWTSHYRQWTLPGRGRALMVRFETLREVSEPLLRELGDFVGHRGAVRLWRNPFEALARVEPGFFREGSSRFAEDEDWPPLANQLFNFLHGALLEELGYPVLGGGAPPAELTGLFEWASRLVARNRELHKTCDERLALIDRLSLEAEKRLEIINRLSPKKQAG